MSEKKKRQHGPVPIPIGTTTAITQYRSKWTNRELIDLLNELTLYAETIPTDLYYQLRGLIVGQMVTDIEEHHKLRHRVRCEAIDKVGWDESAEEAAKHFSGTSEATIRRSYNLVERSLPPEQRRQRRPKGRSKRQR
jgi:hypothetical protein